MSYRKLNLKDGNIIDEKVFHHIDNNFENIYNINEDYFIHISFDDVLTCISNLTKNNYTNLFDEPFFGWLKDLHDNYDAKFSLYIYDLTTLSSVPTTYKQDFFNARHWLKFGLHSKQAGYNYSDDTYDNAKKDWNSLVSNILRITGSYQSIDRIPRLHNFAGNINVVKGMKDAACGIKGFLGADDSRISYHLTTEQNNILKTESTYLDTENGIIILKTNYRGEWLNNVDGMYDKMTTFLSDASYVNSFKPFVWFTHEPYVYKSTGLTEYKKNVEDVCKFAYDNNISFAYPQNIIGVNPTWFTKQ